MADEKRQPSKLTVAAPQQPGQNPPKVVSSQDLMQGRRELWIDHEGEIYRLRITSRGKLYLTK